MNTIKLGAIEGEEVRDAAQWLKPILGDYLNKMKIGKKGFLFSFIDTQHVIAGKVFVPSTGELWHSEKEVGFNCERLYKAFSIFRRKEKTELYLKEDVNRLFLKNGALKWRYIMEDVEAAQPIDFSKIPTPSIILKLEDILPLKQVNKGKRASDKTEVVAFKYRHGKAIIYLVEGENIIKLAEIKAEGEGEGVAQYDLIQLEKLLKDAKAGLVRIGEGKPLKMNVRTGRKTKAVLYLAPRYDEDLKYEIKDLGSPSSPTVTTEEEKEEEKKEGGNYGN